MNWPLVLRLSLFGLAMGICPVFFVPSTVEPLLWLAVFIACAYLVGKAAVMRPFLHGLAIGIVNSVWVTGTHVLLFAQYITRHPREMEMMATMPLANHPRLMMLVTGPIIGVISGIIIGAFCAFAARLMRSRALPAPAA